MRIAQPIQIQKGKNCADIELHRSKFLGDIKKFC